ncbi:MAG: hypothetical protein IKD50_12835 [Clostridia bacterium]|nr:hypothetical protein [Clostridia bacterium]
MKVILQVSTGLFGRCTAADTEDTGRRLEKLFRRLPVRGVIYGWGKTDGLFERILEVTRRHGAEAWLWLPVFADIRDPAHADPMALFGTENAGNVRTSLGEEFHFVCPASEKNRNQVMEAYEALTAGCGPDGVFLDRIRYPSAVRGAVYFYGCRCGICRERLNAAGMDPEAFRRRIGPAESLDGILPERLENGRYHYRDPDPERLSAVKRSTITEAVARYSEAFHRRGIRIGVDTFAPALADLVGQDLHALMPMVDMMKPMMYFRTLAPAGIPCETQAYGKPLSNRLSALWGREIRDPGSMAPQLRSLPDSGGKVCPGIEVNRIPGLCEPDGASLREAIRGIRAGGCDTAVLSWNVLQAREEEIRELERILKEG